MLSNARRYFSTARRFVGKFYETTKNPLFRDLALKSTNVPPGSPWYLVTHGVHSPEQASGELMDGVFAHIQKENAKHTGPLLVLTAAELSRFNLLLPLQRVVYTFLTTSEVSEADFNLLLQALSSNRWPSPEAADLIVSVLTAMSSRQLQLSSQTYKALLRDRYVPLQLTKHLHIRMIQEGYVPTADQLERFLRVFAKNGAIHDATAYWEAIQATQGEEEKTRANTLMLNAHAKRLDAFAFLRALKREEPETSAHDTHRPSTSRPHMKSVAAVNPTAIAHRPHPDPTYHSTAALHVSAKDRSTSTDRLIRSFLLLSNPTNARPTNSTRPSSRTKSLTTATYTILIRALLHRNQPRHACTFFSKLCKSPLVVDNAALSAGIEALVRNGEPHQAFIVLEKYAWKPGLASTPFSSHGLKEANLEVEEVSIIHSPPSKKRKMKLPPRPLPEHQPVVRIKTQTVNNFMRALLSPRSSSTSTSDPSSTGVPHIPLSITPSTPRHSRKLTRFHHPPAPSPIHLNNESEDPALHPRPDLVFSLFKHMSTLYGSQCAPNSNTLQLLIKAGILGMQLDDTLVGKLREFGMGEGMGMKALRTLGLGKLFPTLTPLHPFKTVPRAMNDFTSSLSNSSTLNRRGEALLDILSVIGHPSHGGLRRYMSSMTKEGQLPDAFVKSVWTGVCWALGDELAKVRTGEGRNVLEDVELPARAVRYGPEDDAGDSGSLGLGFGLRFYPKPHTIDPQPSYAEETPSIAAQSALTHSPHSYPTLIPTPTTLHEYVLLLGLASRAPEIPQVLAWMKALGIRPLKETLAIALIFWSEVTIGSPLRTRNARSAASNSGSSSRSFGDEHLKVDRKDQHSDVEDLEGPQYHALHDWISSWVGQDNVPGWEMIRHWRGVVRNMRGGN